MTDEPAHRARPEEAGEVRPPPGFEHVLEEARRTGRPAWDMELDRDLVFLGWAGHTADAAHGMPLGRPEEVISRLRALADKLDGEQKAQTTAAAGSFMLK